MGGHDGPEYPAESFVSWDEIRKAITPINRMCNLNLLLMIGACNGAHAFNSLLVESVVKAEPAACWGVWGPEGNILPDALFSTQMTFYRDLFSDSNDRDPLRKALLSARPIGSLFFSSAQTCFEKAKALYFADHGSSRRFKKRAKVLADKHEMQTGMRKTTKEIEKALKDASIQHFKTCREKFFMINIYPENETRFADRSN